MILRDKDIGRSGRALLGAIGLVLMTSGTVDPASFRVNSSVDTHDVNPGDGVASDKIEVDSTSCSLRAAVEEASALPGPDTIIVPATVSPVYLTLGELTLLDASTIIQGEARPTVDGVFNQLNRPTFVVSSDSNVIAGLTIRRSRSDAVVVTGAANRIGIAGPEGRNVLIGNGLDNVEASAVIIHGSAATANRVSNNYIGVYGNGTQVSANRNGVRIAAGASAGMIGGIEPGARNYISGNSGYGVIIEGGAFGNQVAGNYIGADVSGDAAPGNGSGGIVVRQGAHHNVIGGLNLDQGNRIAGNGGHGIDLEGPEVYGNTINGNVLGLDQTGEIRLGNLGEGIRLATGTHDNLIGGADSVSGNIISGNALSGLRITGDGTMYNTVTANWIGLTYTGYSAVGNGWLDGDGILIDSGAQFNQIGADNLLERNVVSGNYRFGVHIDGLGTTKNRVTGNYVGTNQVGRSSVFNSVGVVISGGARQNYIGGDSEGTGNVISGNRADFFPYGAGVLIYGEGTAYNYVWRNLIGLDINGDRALSNGSSGIIIGDGAQYNTIGGDNLKEANYIAGNGALIEPVPGIAAGIHLYGVGTRYNRIVGNFIGLGKGDPKPVLGNAGHGVGLFAGADRNQIGGDSFYQTNTITASEGHGVIVSGPETQQDLIRYNRIYNNDSLGIAVRDSAQDGIKPPTLTKVGALYITGPRLIVGRGAPPGGTVDIYEVVTPDPSGAGEGRQYLGSGVANSLGEFNFHLPSAIAKPILVTAVAIDGSNNTSEFSPNRWSDDVTGIEDDAAELVPADFELAQNYPNPFNAGTVIDFSLPVTTDTRLEIFNTLGQRVVVLIDERLSPGRYTVPWDGTSDTGELVASGLYFYRLSTENRKVTRKMLLLK